MLNKYKRNMKIACYYNRKFRKLAQKLIGKLSIESFNLYYRCNDLELTENYFKKLKLTSSATDKIKRRDTIVFTLRSIDYKRNGNNWTEPAVVGFMSEVMSLYNNACLKSDEQFKADLLKISKRYAVKSNRLKTQVALFINNLAHEKDKFNLLNYFSVDELFLWRYPELEKFQNDLEAGKISAKQLDIIKKFGLI